MSDEETPKHKPQLTTTMDITDPFYIHHSDHPSLHLVSKPLDGDNYSTWSRAMTISLSTKNKLSFVDGLWDELASYNTIPACTCGTMKAINEREQQEQVIQFLMGLDNSYSAVRGQILLMQPLPNIRKVYS
ncbi:hypothetical protein D8674_037713 [Pyrus ussuriensis x Pyrus communis]|uniref:Retrotransposon Copia-like N-terminal domain-containing protein n=1 Tax=Pyrus ussuriensis x Pyrus communis TaxID=2448454 RepID=A0A5N5H1X9_9ROSA|nr:hypothetical protein D8674_037713 [Pyrus ussuriensis x Pyrus communis]